MNSTVASPPSGQNRLVVSERIEKRLNTGELTQAQVDQYTKFLDVAERELMQHRIVRGNPYCEWF